MQLNPGWGDSGPNLLHIRAEGPADTLHFVWGSLGAPTVLLVATDTPRSNLSVNWTLLLSPDPSGALRIEPPGSVIYSTAIIFTKVFESSHAQPGGETFYPPYDLSQFSWENLNSTLNRTALTAEFWGVPATDPSGSFANGSLGFQVTAYETAGRASSLPRLLHSCNSSQVQFVLAGVAPRGNVSRFTLEVATVEEQGVAQRLRSLRSIDDEYTPAVFETLALVAGSRDSGCTRSFLQWKATAYSSRSPGRGDSIQCRPHGLQVANWTLPESGLVRALFGDGVGSNFSVSAINISFGGEEGRGYQESHYLSWSALLGFGEPPEDSFSPLVISLTAAALGTPLLLLLLGSCSVLCARRKRYSEYDPIN
ncbi:GLMPB protein, partial [Upupa epops]|nr:GLMPB protein [Upupa epops]